MEIREMVYVVKVAEEKSFSLAAQKLFITQPSLSQSIFRIEQQLGVRLFDRNRKPIRLTFAGEKFVETAQNILALEQQLERQMADIANLKTERIVFGVSPFRSKYFLPIILPVFHKKYPDIEIVIREEQSSNLESSILSGEIDFSIQMLPITSKEMTYTPIREEQPVLVVAKHHPLHLNPNIDWNTRPYPIIKSMDELKNENWIILTPEAQGRPMIDNFFKSKNFTPKSITESKFLESAHALAVAGYGVAIITDALIPYCAPKYRGSYFVLAEPYSPKIQLVFAYRKNAYLSKATQAFFSVAKQLFK